MKVLDDTGLSYLWSKISAHVPAKTAGIPYAQVDSTSTSTAYTATVDGITDLHDGVCVLLKNGVATSESGFTININNLGAKPSYNNMTDATRDTTIFNINYTMLFVYDSNRGDNGGWICYRGYNSNDDITGYQLRTNYSTLPMKQTTYRYRLLFTSADNSYWVPANTTSSINSTSSRTVNQNKIDPFGEIVYYSATASVAANAYPASASLWQQHTVTLGYSFNTTGVALTLTNRRPVYVKCTPQADGSAIMDSATPIVQGLPTTEDGKIYIYLGTAYGATSIELTMNHPVYYYKDGGIRLWDGKPIDWLPLDTYKSSLKPGKYYKNVSVVNTSSLGITFSPSGTISQWEILCKDSNNTPQIIKILYFNSTYSYRYEPYADVQ